VVRYPKGAVCAPIPAVRTVEEIDVLAEHGQNPQVVVFGVGSMAGTAIEVAGKLAAEGTTVMAATATWVHPVPEGLLEALGDAELVVTVEDGLTDAGVGEEWAEFARLAGHEVRWSHHGVPREFLEHASRAQVLEHVGLEASVIADAAIARLG